MTAASEEADQPGGQTALLVALRQVARAHVLAAQAERAGIRRGSLCRALELPSPKDGGMGPACGNACKPWELSDYGRHVWHKGAAGKRGLARLLTQGHRARRVEGTVPQHLMVKATSTTFPVCGS